MRKLTDISSSIVEEFLALLWIIAGCLILTYNKIIGGIFISNGILGMITAMLKEKE